MRISFGIVTDGTKDERIAQIINSIYANNIPRDSFEIIIVGNSRVVADNTRVIPFGESPKPMWITRKKNIITQEARFDTIVYSHDYFSYHNQWYQGFLNFHEDWDLCMCPLMTTDGQRYRDFSRMGRGNEGGSWYWIPYQEKPIQWDISGGWWVGRKEWMKRFPLDESLCWGDGEDVAASDLWRSNNARYVCNPNSWVHLMKPKQVLCRWK